MQRALVLILAALSVPVIFGCSSDREKLQDIIQAQEDKLSDEREQRQEQYWRDWEVAYKDLSDQVKESEEKNDKIIQSTIDDHKNDK